MFIILIIVNLDNIFTTINSLSYLICSSTDRKNSNTLLRITMSAKETKKRGNFFLKCLLCKKINSFI